jgi:hypothetical protein
MTFPPKHTYYVRVSIVSPGRRHIDTALSFTRFAQVFGLGAGAVIDEPGIATLVRVGKLSDEPLGLSRSVISHGHPGLRLGYGRFGWRIGLYGLLSRSKFTKGRVGFVDERIRFPNRHAGV